MSRVASTVIPAVCGLATTVSSDEQRMARIGRLVVEHVDAGARDRAAHQRVVQRGLVVHRSAGGRDEERGRLHARELLGTDQPLGLGRQRAVEVHEVGAFEQLVELDLRRAPRRRLRRRRGTGRRRARSSRTARRARRAGHRSVRRRRCPSVLPSSSLLRSGMRSCTTSRRIMRSASAIFFASASMKPSACSATASRPGPELLHTITPGGGARVDVDDVVARTRRAHREQVGAPLQERRSADPLLGDAGVAGQLGADERLVAVRALRARPSSRRRRR